MRATLNLRDDLIKGAMRLTQVKEKTAVIYMGLEALIEKHARQRLIALGGSDNKATAPKRRR